MVRRDSLMTEGRHFWFFRDHLADDFASVKVRRHETHDHGHGRDEMRFYYVCPVPDDLPDQQHWRQLRAIGLGDWPALSVAPEMPRIMFDEFSRLATYWSDQRKIPRPHSALLAAEEKPGEYLRGSTTNNCAKIGIERERFFGK